MSADEMKHVLYLYDPDHKGVKSTYVPNPDYTDYDTVLTWPFRLTAYATGAFMFLLIPLWIVSALFLIATFSGGNNHKGK